MGHFGSYGLNNLLKAMWLTSSNDVITEISYIKVGICLSYSIVLPAPIIVLEHTRKEKLTKHV